VFEDPRQQAARLSADLEFMLVHRLRAEWDYINYAYFKEVLRPPILSLADTRTRLGQWNKALRSLEISRSLVLEWPWVEVQEVLKHEVAHQYVDEVLGADEPPHGPTFQAVCRRLGIDARAVAGPSPEREPGPEDKVVARIRKLLALAQSPNQNEAELAATAARRLMLKFNIEVDQAGPAEAERKRYGYRTVGAPSGRTFEHQRRLARILTEYFFVEGVWVTVYRPREGKTGSVFEICGLEPNLQMAEHVHAFLLATAERLWVEYKRAAKIKSNRDRQAFLAGIMRGFSDKLAAQATEFQEQGLVWVPNAELGGYFRRRHPRIQTIRRGGARRNAAFAEGQRAGRDIVLSKPVESSSASGGRPKALRSGG
jgi:hypothetical protein